MEKKAIVVHKGNVSKSPNSESIKRTKERRSKSNNDRKSAHKKGGDILYKTVQVNVVDDDDDDDFVQPPKRQKVSIASIQTPNRQPTKPFVDYMDKKLKAIVGVVNLKNSISGLSKQQRKAIISMGFKPFLSLEVETVPTRLAQWLLSNYDSDNNELNAGNHTIKVTPSTVKDVLGIPLGRLPVNEKNKPRLGSSNTLNVWKSQYQNKSRITVKDVFDQIKSNENGDWLFKLNWLVVYNIVLGWTTKSTTVNQRFLNSIIKDSDIPNMNWCEYLITCLQRTKKEWTSNEPFNGPLLFLALLYVHGKRTRYLSTLPTGSTIENVTNNYLIELDSHLYENGPFTDYETGSPEEACDFEDDESEHPLDANVGDDEEHSDRVCDDPVVEEEDVVVAVNDSHLEDV
ncbi:hypothetical protein E3N88_06242 [Mikania micrantha]|uniref:Aminotransferase-like plant mobile domain-containing protein n=1 Tax=Mikania micrantha TaxID=192012 RepID=A0A5N6PPD8_9ASTR|nr:hypothetical protein E3N88_06242 [Mikania micrantha]